MAWQNPKTNWASADGVRDTDMNRIEGNTLELYNETARSAKIIYVATTGDDDTGTGASGSPFKTITKALSTLPKNLAGLNVNINIASGTYPEAVSIKGIAGGVLRLSGTSSLVTLNSLSIEAAIVSAVSLPLSLTAAVGLILSERASFNTTSNVTTTGSSIGVSVSGGSSARISGDHIHSGGGNAVSCTGNSNYCANVISGTGTLQATNGGVIAAATSSLTRSTSGGGRVHIGSQGSGGGVLPATVE